MSNTVEIIAIEPLAVRPQIACALIGISPRKFAEMRTCGLLPPAYKLGGCLLYKTNDLRQWVELGFPNTDRFLALQEVARK